MSTTSHTEVSSFQTETTAAIADVRTAMSQFVRSLGEDIHRASDLQRLLGVDYKLSWQIFNLINEADAMTAAKLVPGAPSLQRLVRVAKNKAVPAAVVEKVKRALAKFDRVVELYAEDRVEFDLMASSIGSASAAAAAELVYRKMSFRGDSHTWGVNANVFCGSAIVRLNRDTMTTDELALSARRGYRRLRPDASLNVFFYRNYGADGPPPGQESLPLDHKAAERYGAFILPRFCSQPIPPFRTWKRPDGFTAVDVLSHEIGSQHAVDLTLGKIFRGCPLAKGLKGDPYYQSDIRIVTPTKVMVSFLLLHRPSFGRVQPQLFAFRSTPGDDNMAVAQSVAQLPIREGIQYLGSGRPAWQIPDVESHDELVQTALNEVGWNPVEFDVFRIRIEYPVLHSVVRMGFEVQ